MVGVSFTSFLPPGFPSGAHHKTLEAAARRGQGRSGLDEFVSAWNAVMYRYRTCYDASVNFTQSMSTLGINPTLPARYEQERDLFVFFVSGESVLESLCYALWSWGSISNPQTFPLTSDKDKRDVSPDRTSRVLGSCSPVPAIASSLGRVVNSCEFSAWKETRNTLAHRSAPGRRFSITVGIGFANLERSAVWQLQGIPIDITTTTSRLDWLQQQLKTLIPDCLEFVLTT